MFAESAAPIKDDSIDWHALRKTAPCVAQLVQENRNQLNRHEGERIGQVDRIDVKSDNDQNQKNKALAEMYRYVPSAAGLK